MPFTKTTTRALAASIALVAAGATVAAAAVFQLPILGFGHASIAAASAVPARAVVQRSVKPKVIVKVRYVDDIVHRRAPASTNALRSSQKTAFPPQPIASVSAPMPTPAVPTTIARGPAMLTAPTKVPPTEDAHDAHEDDGPSLTGHSTETAQAPAPAVDQ